MKTLRSWLAVAAGTCVLASTVALTGCAASWSTARGVSPTAGKQVLPKYDHVVLVVFENHARSQVIGSGRAPYLTSLARQGADFTRSYAIAHPSEPNYLDLFAGYSHGIHHDSCAHDFAANNLGNQLIRSGHSFVGYTEGIASAGSGDCYSRRVPGKQAPRNSVAVRPKLHAAMPWLNFTDLKQSVVDKPYAAFPTDFNRLPSNAWVIPNLCHDMHNCSVATGDRWARGHLDKYAQWAKTHNSLLIVTFDEGVTKTKSRIPTFFIGAHIKPGNYRQYIDHYALLRTIEAIFGLPPLGHAKNRTPITDVFSGPPTASGLPAASRMHRFG